MADDLSALESWAGGLLAKLEAPARRKLLRDLARELRKSQQARITKQLNPDGSTYQARKPRPKKHLRDKAGRVKRQAMFAKLKQARFLRAESDSQGLTIGFVGRVARVARVHQFGESDHVASNGPQYKYPARVLLGLTDTDRDLIADMLLAHLTK